MSSPAFALSPPVFDFAATLRHHELNIDRSAVEILQVNIGKRCNQACHHCHVESGPKRTEAMDRRVLDRLLTLLDASPGVHSVDITGGAPELNPHFRYFVTECRKRGLTVVDRCNLTILFEPEQEDTALFLADQGVHVIASLPCYSRENVEKQRGLGVFNKSVEGLRQLNALGYGDTLPLDLVYNPLGAYLPPSQAKLEDDYRRELDELFGIRFTRLYTITNMPIKRFLHDLQRSGEYDRYLDLLVSNFNVQAALGVMCRNLVSVSWDGQLHDCDFNQMLELPLGAGQSDIWSLNNLNDLEGKAIRFESHCYGCTAGAGSSCGGALA